MRKQYLLTLIVLTTLVILPNPSGLNAHYQAKDLAKLFGELKRAVEETCRMDDVKIEAVSR